jgi:hypothetical protein
MKTSRLVALVLALGVVLAGTLASARPGGGSSFSRPSSSSSSSGGSRSFSTSSSSSGGSRSWSTSSSSSGGSRSWSTSSSSSSSSSGSHWSTTSSSSSSGSSSWGTASSSSTSSSGYGGSTYTSTSSSGYSPPANYDPVPTYPSSPSTYIPDAEPQRPVTHTFWKVFLGIVIVVGLIVAYGRWRQQRMLAEWEAQADANEQDFEREQQHTSITTAMQRIREQDEAFSQVLFEDFLYALYAEVHTARGKGTIAQLAPYLSGAAQSALAGRLVASVDTIVIGGMRIEAVRTSPSKNEVDVVFMTNQTETDHGGTAQAYYVEERWKLTRSTSATSRPPSSARVIGCPSCGAPLDKTIDAKCGYCGKTSTHGQTDWFVERVQELSREPRGPMLTGTTEEVGTDWPTVADRDAPSELGALKKRDPAFTWPAFVARIDKAFRAFHASWSSQDLKGVRPYLSDNLYELQTYWVKAYQAQGLRNVTDQPHIVAVHLARVTRDKFYESLTVRVFASCFDYTVDASGSVVGGSKDKARDYSEYWTFIRAAGKTGAPRADDACPSCGAPLADIEMAGTCSHCHAKITTGDFDWVLSRIEQDEAYEQAA